jgi:hypothetical protein
MYVEILKGLNQYDKLFDADNYDETDRWIIKIENGEII